MKLKLEIHVYQIYRGGCSQLEKKVIFISDRWHRFICLSVDYSPRGSRRSPSLYVVDEIPCTHNPFSRTFRGKKSFNSTRHKKMPAGGEYSRIITTTLTSEYCCPHRRMVKGKNSQGIHPQLRTRCSDRRIHYLWRERNYLVIESTESTVPSYWY